MGNPVSIPFNGISCLLFHIGPLTKPIPIAVDNKSAQSNTIRNKIENFSLSRKRRMKTVVHMLYQSHKQRIYFKWYKICTRHKEKVKWKKQLWALVMNKSLNFSPTHLHWLLYKLILLFFFVCYISHKVKLCIVKIKINQLQ